MSNLKYATVVVIAALMAPSIFAQVPSALELGTANHAFDHLSDIGDQAPAAAASGATVIYASGVGIFGYDGLPTQDKLAATASAFADYTKDARQRGIKTVIGYVCATSIVKLNAFDKNWTPEFRSQFKTPVSDWRQQDKTGKPLASWYGGDYQPACMNNPDWQTYEKAIVRKQIESGCDGIFFDNPTVHEQGCYCQHCMKKFAAFIDQPTASIDEARKQAIARPTDFAKFRATTVRDFLAEMRTFARTIKPEALITCNNSLNSPEVFFTQCRSMAYDIYEMSKTEDFVCLEDMATQPRTLPTGETIEYGPIYQAVEAISHGKPVVAVTIADGDYHTPPNLMRLAMAEAAAHGAAYLMWPTWPKEQRERMIAAVRPQSDLLRDNAGLLNNTTQATDAIVYLPFRQWTQTAECKPMATARALATENIQFKVICEDDFAGTVAAANRPFIIESAGVLTAYETKTLEQFKSRGGQVITTDSHNWLAELKSAIKLPILTLKAQPTVRAVVRQAQGETIVHLLNLNIQRLSSYEDKVTPAANVQVHLHLKTTQIKSVRAVTVDRGDATEKLEWTSKSEEGGVDVDIAIPQLQISQLLVVE